MKKSLITVCIVIAVAVIFGLCSYFVKRYLFHESVFETMYSLFQNFSISEILNHPLFWTSSVGISLKIIIDIVATTLVLWTGFVVARRPLNFGILVRIVSISQIVFLLQFFSEAIYISTFSYGKTIESFSFLSIGFFTYLFDCEYVPALQYAFHILSFFELFFICIMALLVRRFYPEIKFLNSLATVTLSYGGVLLLWLIIITVIIFVG